MDSKTLQMINSAKNTQSFYPKFQHTSYAHAIHHSSLYPAALQPSQHIFKHSRDHLSKTKSGREICPMRPSLVRLVRPRRPERTADALLPPLQLYRAILRAHVQKLPVELRPLGDEYVKAEFKAHKNADNPLHIVGFLTQWQDYLKSIDGGSWMQGKLSKAELDKMSPEQIGQLYELMQETKRISS